MPRPATSIEHTISWLSRLSGAWKARSRGVAGLWLSLPRMCSAREALDDGALDLVVAGEHDQPLAGLRKSWIQASAAWSLPRAASSLGR